WLVRASGITQRLAGSAGSFDDAFPEAELAELQATAPDSELLALALHIRAQVLFAAGKSGDAGPAFEIAAQAWMQEGDHDRAAAALAGAADDAIRAGRYAAAIAL